MKIFLPVMGVPDFIRSQAGNTKEQNEALRFHWHIMRPAVANDIEIAKKMVFE